MNAATDNFTAQRQKTQCIARGIFTVSPSPSAAKVGIVYANAAGKEGQCVYLIDSGGQSSDGDIVLNAVKDLLGSIPIRAVILTHSHSDHAGGAAEIARVTGAEIWATAGERGGIENNKIQATVTCGGMPMPEIDVPYYVPETCTVSRVIGKDDVIELGDDRQMTFYPLPGHYFDMAGVVVESADNKRVFFVSDALFGRQMVGRFPIPYMIDIASFLNTLQMIESFNADVFVPSHGDILANSSETVEMNRLSILTTVTAIEKVLSNPLTTDEVLTAVFNEEHLTMKGQQYFLVGSTMRSFLAYLYRAGRIMYTIKDNRLLWQRK